MSLEATKVKTAVLKGASIVTHEGVMRKDLLVKGTQIGRLGSDLSADEIVGCRGCYVLPGFRDQHIHDLKGFIEHLDDPGRLRDVSRSLAAQGVTAYVVATTAAPTEDLVTYLKAVKEYMSSRNGLDGASVEGVNIEGTFIRKECAGAQPIEYIVPPNEPEAKRVLDALLETGVVKLVNIAPDFGIDLIEHAARRNVIIGCGHCLATAEQLAEGMKYGLKFIVHLTNGAMGRSFKPFSGGGTYEGALTLPLFIELIVDGYHVDWRYVSDIIWRRVQQGRGHEIIAVTDGIFPIPEEIPDEDFRVFSTLCAKSPDEGVFVVKGRVGDDGCVLPVPRDTLCSSKLTMKKAFENLLNLLTTNLDGYMIDRKALQLHEAIRQAALFTSTNQALMQGTIGRTGTIKPGKSADLTVLKIEGEQGEYKVKVERTVVAGKVFSNYDEGS